MKKLICVCLIVLLMVPMCFSLGESGLLPSLTETVGIGMPSLGEALQRYPDSETENEDGSVTELYTNVSESDFNTFSVYLEQQEAELVDYQVEQGVVKAEIQVKGAVFNLSYDSKSSEARTTYPSGTFDERIKSAKTHFAKAEELLEEGKVYGALSEIQEIPQYNEYLPASDLLKNNENLVAASEAVAVREEKLAQYKKNKVVLFGRYEQDGDKKNGPEDIEWIVLDVQDGKCLLLSKYGIAAGDYGKESIWEKSKYREWLNNDFINSAFDNTEKSAILLTEVNNSKDQGKWKRNGGKNTQDWVFLLSYAEANQYLSVDEQINVRARTSQTEYVHQKTKVSGNIYNDTSWGDSASEWWLRSPGKESGRMSCVSAEGSISSEPLGMSDYVVRPALWLNLESDLIAGPPFVDIDE